MKKIDLKKIMKARGYSVEELAPILYPENTYASQALYRVLQGKGELGVTQIVRFSEFSNIPIAELFEGPKWTSKIDGHVHVLSSGDYTAKLNTQTWVTEIFHKKSKYHDFMIHTSSITLSDYINQLEFEIKTHKNDKN